MRVAMSAGSRPPADRMTPASRTFGPASETSRTAYPVTCNPGSRPSTRFGAGGGWGECMCVTPTRCLEAPTGRPVIARGDSPGNVGSHVSGASTGRHSTDAPGRAAGAVFERDAEFAEPLADQVRLGEQGLLRRVVLRGDRLRQRPEVVA